MKEIIVDLLNMALAFKPGQMDPNMKGIGWKGKYVGREDIQMPMGTFMMDSGMITERMGKVFTHIQMGQFIKGIGLMIIRLEMEERYGPMAVITKVSIKMGRRMGLENTNGRMVVFMKEVG
jgi:hypothetical protein